MRHLAFIIASWLIIVLITGGQEGKTRWLNAQGNNQQVELTVFDVTLAPLPDKPDQIEVIVSTAWRNLEQPHVMDDIEWKTTGMGSLAGFGRSRRPTGREAVQHTAYLVPRIGDHVYLVYGVGGIARLEDDEEISLPRHNDEVEWICRFEIDKSKTDALQLVFLDFDNGHIHIPLTSKVPSRQGAAPAAEAANEYIRARLYSCCRTGQYTEIELGLISTYSGNMVELSILEVVRVLTEDGSPASIEKIAPKLWEEESMRILPEWEERGSLRFGRMVKCGKGRLEIALPGLEPLLLALPPDKTKPSPQSE
ncbi:MAG: hypothetical protein JW927_15585 [Deltaproteobacteria bacterium]|nr:hypothetical protein [Deltaproteobacteria bacterium]